MEGLLCEVGCRGQPSPLADARQSCGLGLASFVRPRKKRFEDLMGRALPESVDRIFRPLPSRLPINPEEFAYQNPIDRHAVVASIGDAHAGTIRIMDAGAGEGHVFKRSSRERDVVEAGAGKVHILEPGRAEIDVGELRTFQGGIFGSGVHGWFGDH